MRIDRSADAARMKSVPFPAAHELQYRHGTGFDASNAREVTRECSNLLTNSYAVGWITVNLIREFWTVVEPRFLTKFDGFIGSWIFSTRVFLFFLNSDHY